LLGIAVDGAGSVYVADAGNSRILKETPSGGGYTESVILNTSSSGIAVDGSGNVYITAGGSVSSEGIEVIPRVPNSVRGCKLYKLLFSEMTAGL
jgi:hypothetical protein